MVRQLECEIRENMRGGNGKVYMYPVIPKEELMGHGRLYAKVVLPPGSSIGVHEHIHETEPYYILEGEGIFVDENGDRVPVKAGDSCTILPGQSHGMENPSTDKDLVMMALVYND